MEKKIPFIDKTRDQIIAEQQALDFRLYEEHRHTDGWWLLFTDEPYVEPELPRNLETEIDNIEARVKALEDAQ